MSDKRKDATLEATKQVSPQRQMNPLKPFGQTFLQVLSCHKVQFPATPMGPVPASPPPFSFLGVFFFLSFPICSRDTDCNRGTLQALMTTLTFFGDCQPKISLCWKGDSSLCSQVHFPILKSHPLFGYLPLADCIITWVKMARGGEACFCLLYTSPSPRDFG